MNFKQNWPIDVTWEPAFVDTVKVTFQCQRSHEVKFEGRLKIEIWPSIFVKLKSDLNQTWVIDATWEALTRSKVTYQRQRSSESSFKISWKCKIGLFLNVRITDVESRSHVNFYHSQTATATLAVQGPQCIFPKFIVCLPQKHLKKFWKMGQ